jgi:isocitrate dehydrogenase kinase/phosphatase
MAMTVSERLAKAILNGFDAFFGDFQNITLGAQARFEKADWPAVHTEMANRLSLYKRKVAQVAQVATLVAGDRAQSAELWQQAKLDYVELLELHDNYEIAQTFFNSVYCLLFGHRVIRDRVAFVMSSQRPKRSLPRPSIVRSYTINGDYRQFVTQALQDSGFSIGFEDLSRDVARIVEATQGVLGERLLRPLVAEMLDSVFYRNKAAYLVGRIIDGDTSLPFVLPVLNNERGAIYVDTVLYAPDDVSIVFSFTRSYFMVDASVPSQYVAFLKSIMPQKEVFELYAALGFGKHGKTEFYRRAVWHTRHSDDQYQVAPGVKGMVMLVFTRPSFDYVYKVIKDRFTAPKDSSREQVKAQYRLVKRSDRAGRMAEAQEFSNLVFDRRRFSPELMAELEREVPSLLEQQGNALILRHVYVERKMTPLNLYLKTASDQQVVNVMDEYGNAIKQLCAANVFPGDMLLKNFGVTRHGRVVFYDYDEICPLLGCEFRTIPEPQNEAQEMATEPWYSIAPNDVFPEQFCLFFSGDPRAKAAFEARHADLYEPATWQAMQSQLRAGKVADVYPYRRKYRFPRAGSP